MMMLRYPLIHQHSYGIRQFGCPHADRADPFGEQNVGRGTVEVDGTENGGFDRPALREQGGEQAGEHIAHACG